MWQTCMHLLDRDCCWWGWNPRCRTHKTDIKNANAGIKTGLLQIEKFFEIMDSLLYHALRSETQPNACGKMMASDPSWRRRTRASFPRTMSRLARCRSFLIQDRGDCHLWNEHRCYLTTNHWPTPKHCLPYPRSRTNWLHPDSCPQAPTVGTHR